MDLAEKHKTIYELQYQTILNFMNITLVGSIAIWVAIFLQSDLGIQYKLIITALIINVTIFLFVLFFTKFKSIQESILSL